jgi:hypothetical protein
MTLANVCVCACVYVCVCKIQLPSYIRGHT